ncbi:MAG: DUF4167 domain-containing protein [Rickettsiales bacterium]
MMRKRSPYGHQRHNNNRGGGGQMRRHHRRDGGNTQYEQHDDEHVSPRQRRHAQVQREKYVNLAIDARRSGDRVQAEYWLQHADHYQRILNVAQEQYAARGAQMEDAEEGHDAGGMDASSSNFPQSQGDNFASEASAEDDAYEPSYGTPAPTEQPRRQHQGQRRHQHQQRRPRPEHQDRAEAQGGLEDVLPMPKPERSDRSFDQDEE